MKPDQRWCQYSIPSVFPLILLASVAICHLSYMAWRSALRERAIASIEAAGGKVGFGYQAPRSAPFDPTGCDDYPEPPGPALLRKFLGEHFFTEVRFVDYTFTENTDMRLEHIQDLPEVPWLALWNSKLTDAGLKHLRGLTQLRELSMWYTDITDAGLEHLEGLTQLRVLDIQHTRVTNSGLKHLHGLRNLEELRLSGNRITDRGIESLKDLSCLKVLCLSETDITDAGLEYVIGFSKLRELWLDGTKVTLDGLRRVHQALPNCEIRGGEKEEKRGRESFCE